jgi:hypothetical protein
MTSLGKSKGTQPILFGTIVAKGDLAQGNSTEILQWKREMMNRQPKEFAKAETVSGLRLSARSVKQGGPPRADHPLV